MAGEGGTPRRATAKRAAGAEKGRRSAVDGAGGGGGGGDGGGASRPSAAQRAWLACGLDQAGGKLPLFLPDGRRVDERTVRSCLAAGWAEPWFSNPIKPDWLVCRLTPEGRAALSRNPA